VITGRWGKQKDEISHVGTFILFLLDHTNWEYVSNVQVTFKCHERAILYTVRWFSLVLLKITQPNLMGGEMNNRVGKKLLTLGYNLKKFNFL